MLCRACDISLDSEDNYCRRCGAPVRVIELAGRSERTAVVRVGPSVPAIVAGAARPLVAGAATVAAGALVRFALRRAVQGLVANVAAPRVRPAGRSLRAADQPATPPGGVQVIELLWYRRITRP